MNNPLDLIEKIKSDLSEVIYENNLEYLDVNVDDILKFYSADLVGILINFYPGATIMMHKFYKNCAVLINGKVYNGAGEVEKSDYHIAVEEEIGFIRKSFPEMSDFVMGKLSEKVYDKEKLEKGISMMLRKSEGNIT